MSTYRLSYVLDSGEDKEFTYPTLGDCHAQLEAARFAEGFWFRVEEHASVFFPWRRVLYARVDLVDGEGKVVDQVDLGEPRDVKDAMLRLASVDESYITQDFVEIVQDVRTVLEHLLAHIHPGA